MNRIHIITDEDPVVASIKADSFIKDKNVVKVISYPYERTIVIIIHYIE